MWEGSWEQARGFGGCCALWGERERLGKKELLTGGPGLSAGERERGRGGALTLADLDQAGRKGRGKGEMDFFF